MVVRPVYDGLVAKAGGGQSGATPLNEGINRVATVATIADSVQLPPAGNVVGGDLVVINGAANSMNVFPATGETINALAANAAFAIAGGGRAIFVSMGNRWFAVLSA